SLNYKMPMVITIVNLMIRTVIDYKKGKLIGNEGCIKIE
ncbi:MAG: hypothetical protein RL563_263, partial [Pseudomonadota bacterium]